MDRRSPEKSEAVRFAHRQKPHDQSDLIDQVGHALIALLQEAATVSKENVDRAMTVADKLSIQLRAAEGRIKELEDEVERLESRAARAEAWLQIIKTEIEDKLIGPIEANRPRTSSFWFVATALSFGGRAARHAHWAAPLPQGPFFA